MRREIVLRHEFVEFIPDELREGTVYVSIKFATASHLCCCGCGVKVVTPLRPTDWKLIFDGKSISLHPSIGNWSFACQSHYWIVQNKVQWCGVWTQDEIAAGRAFDKLAKDEYFGDRPAVKPVPPPSTNSRGPGSERPPSRAGWWQRLKRWLGLSSD